MGLRQVIGLHISKYTTNNYSIISAETCRQQKLLMYVINILSCDSRIVYYYYYYYYYYHYHHRRRRRRRNGKNQVKIN